MAIFDDMQDKQKDMQKRLDSTELDDKAKEKIEEMRDKKDQQSDSSN